MAKASTLEKLQQAEEKAQKAWSAAAKIARAAKEEADRLGETYIKAQRATINELICMRDAEAERGKS